MRKKTVMIVEDSEAQRLALHGALDRRGFEVRSAGTVAEATQLIEQLGEKIDVMVLDMRLEDPDAPDITGADIGIALQNQHPNWLPEFLIHSGWALVDYYRLALRLGAAAYLAKEDNGNLSAVIRHVRALALKRALRLERAQVAETLRSISESTRNLSAAVRKFCQDVLAGELDACLGAPYILLLTDENGTQNFATNTDLPTGYESLYTTLQAMAHGISNFASPYEISTDSLKNLPEPTNPTEAKIYERLPKSAFIPLANVKNFRLSLGILRPVEGSKHQEHPGELAKVLAQYVRSTIVEHLLRILVHLDSQKRTMLKSTARLCLFLGQDQQRIVDEAINKNELKGASLAHYRLGAMADDLCQTGAILSNVAVTDIQNPYDSIEMSEVIKKARAELEARMYLRGVEFKLEGACGVKAREDDLYIAVIRILQWLAQRKLETDSRIEPQIKVRCVGGSDSSLVVFEDKSMRLPEELREQLFLPFSISVISTEETRLRAPGLYLPLYLAKMLIEEKYGGWLDDQSDEIEGEIGHRIVMRFDHNTMAVKAAAASD